MTPEEAIDARESYAFWCHMMRLKLGLRRFECLWELYLVEQWGGVP